MVSSTTANPAFGQADLSNCEREQINLAASIQPHGALLLVREPDLTIVQISANTPAYLGVADTLIGKRLDDLGGDLAELVSLHLDQPLDLLPIAIRCQVGSRRRDLDGLIHRPPGGGLVVEVEAAGPTLDLAAPVEQALQTIVSSSSLRGLCDDVAEIFRNLTGYDRVMVYRFDEDGHGEVLSEQRQPSLESFLGNRYPASDIPQIARRLYERNRVRVLVDVAYEPVALKPRLSPITGVDLDMSFCALRSMSPIHIQYLKNMGVGATLVASLMVAGKLWGLIACHHYSPRQLQFEIRAAVELLAEAVATRIAALESFVQAQAELSVRRLEQRMVEAISRDGDWRSALFDSSDSLLKMVSATGAALLFDGQIITAGEVPSTQTLRQLGNWLDRKANGAVFATASLSLEDPDYAALTPIASGVLATPISRDPGEYLVWFRPEHIRTVTWGGNPFKPVTIGNDPSDLSPRRSFSQWHQLMECQSEKWTPADLTAARLVGNTVSDVIVQFRSVRMLIAEDQLEQIRRQVRLSEQPIIVANAEGRILLGNAAFERLFDLSPGRIEIVDDLRQLFADPAEARRRLDDLVSQGVTWRGEIRAKQDCGQGRPLLVRADPVFSSPKRILGFVILLTDLTEQKAAATARDAFQRGIIEGHRIVTGRLGSGADLLYQRLLSPIVENAQLAALEITDRIDTSEMPQMLESVRSSVDRAVEMLEHLALHSARRSKE